MRFKIKIGILILSACVCASSLIAADRTVWTLGQFDGSSIEFKGHGDFSNPDFHPVVTVGKGDPAKDWPSHQAGSMNKDAGSRRIPTQFSST